MNFFRVFLFSWVFLAGALENQGIQREDYENVAFSEKRPKAGNTHVFVSGGREVSLTPGSLLGGIDGVRVYLQHPPVIEKGALWIHRQDWRSLLDPVTRPYRLPPPPSVRRVVLDPGHGGKDPGARNEALGLWEKDLTLDLARRLRHRLQVRGFEVILTREDDEFVPLEDRSALAEEGDLFLSLHFNAAPSTGAAGVETFILPPAPVTGSGEGFPGNDHDAANALLGFALQSRLATHLPSPDRGLRRARFAVLRELPCPGALVEAGFLTEQEEARRIGEPAYREKIAEALMQAVEDYVARLRVRP